MRKSNHTIDFLFPIALFFVFAASALFVLLFSANIYENVVTSSNSAFETGTSLSYVTQKIRQSDSESNISIATFDGCQALAIREVHGEKSYTTYIYETDGYLKELFLQDGVTATAEAGTVIMEVTDFQMKEMSGGLLEFTCTAADGSKDSVVIGTYTQ